ncbi:MAG: hypothetical protein JNM45_15730 [Rhizobiales bacterium]|nr:hypothetical protein [Hyphomicrobiales bacterium]
MWKKAGLAGASAVLSVLAAGHVWAASLALTGKDRWLTVASTKDLETARAIAEVYSSERAKVVSSQSGWYAIILGPYREGSVAAITKAHAGIGTLPQDAHLSRGDRFLEVIFEEKPWEEQRPLSTYEAKKPARFSDGSITYTVEMGGSDEQPGPTVASAKEGDKMLFSFTTPNDYSMFGSDAGLLKLDPGAKGPQLVFTRFTGGAHCCTQTWIATSPEGGAGWSLVDAGVFDGGAYYYEDVDGDGFLEMLLVDNDFLYAFDSYAGSFAPIRIFQLRGSKLLDVSNAPAMRGRLKRDLAAMEFQAKLDPGLWKSNGFLSGWVAAKERLGEGEDAWQTVLENIDPNTDFGPDVCKTGKPLDECPYEDLEKVPVGKALARFLSERDYGELPPMARALLK